MHCAASARADVRADLAVDRGRPAPPPPARPILRRLRDPRLWRTAAQPVLAGIGGMIAAPIGLLLWYDLGLDALQVGIIGIAAMLGGALGFWHGGRLADRIEPGRLLATGAAVQAVGSALLACVGFLGDRGGLGTGALCAVGIALAFAGAALAAIAAMAQTKLVFRRVVDGAAGDFACIGTMSSVLGLMATATSGLLAVWLQRQAADMPYGVPPALPQLVLAMLASLVGWSLLRRHGAATCA
jgi:MFS family permease